MSEWPFVDLNAICRAAKPSVGGSAGNTTPTIFAAEGPVETHATPLGSTCASRRRRPRREGPKGASAPEEPQRPQATASGAVHGAAAAGRPPAYYCPAREIRTLSRARVRRLLGRPRLSGPRRPASGARGRPAAGRVRTYRLGNRRCLV
ncbi:hypothetical protein M885DRAFT_517902 [Pelagophyceae sp. CCMP2097]|nr:hypothetical protein M885DRAFT_517902 [Pelagophyceae sp. CCMP2097]